MDRWARGILAAAALLGVACGPTSASPGASASSSETGADGSTSASSTTAGASTTSTSGAQDEASSVGTSAASTGDTGSITTADSGDPTGDATGDPTGDTCIVGCDGDFEVECADGMDNDGDGSIDLLDPECTSPCDEDEGSFHSTNLGNFDCKWDCGFDGNAGQGDDTCTFDLTCDEENPGGELGCAYGPQHECEPVVANDQCFAYCEPLVPPGCDCFGCCVLSTDDGDIAIFLEGHWECSLSNLDVCTSCTPRIDECGNACTPDRCEICFGQSAPPGGCVTNACDAGEPCTSDADCPCAHYCLLGCCYPPHPG